MPCDSSHMEANRLEIELSRLSMLLDEFRTGEPVDPMSSGWNGYAVGVYNSATRDRTDKATAELCALLTACPDVTKFSLEMQTWWRNHQRADAARLAREARDAEENKLRERALAKLTDEERAALRLNGDIFR